MGSFFKGNQNLKIYGGEFNNVKGNLEITNNYGQHGREMPSMRSRTGYREEDYTGHPPPHRPPFSPPENPSTVFQAAFLQQMGVGGPPGPHIPANGANIQRPPFSPPQYPSTVPFQAPFPQQMGFGGPPDPHMSAHGTNIQHLNQQMRWYYEQCLQSTIPQTQSGNGGGNYGPQTAYSSTSCNADSMNTGMANLSLNDFRPQVPAHPSPPTSFSSDLQIDPKPTNQTGSNPATSAVQQGSLSNPSPAPHMKERDMIDSHSPPTKNSPHDINPNRPPPPASTSPSDFPSSSSSGPSFNGQDSLNGNSFVDPTGKPSATESNQKRGFLDPNVPIGTRKKKDSGVGTPGPPDPNQIDEETSSDETDEQLEIPTAVGKQKKAKKWFFLKRVKQK